MRRKVDFDVVVFFRFHFFFILLPISIFIHCVSAIHSVLHIIIYANRNLTHQIRARSQYGRFSQGEGKNATIKKKYKENRLERERDDIGMRRDVNRCVCTVHTMAYLRHISNSE